MPLVIRDRPRQPRSAEAARWTRPVPADPPPEPAPAELMGPPAPEDWSWAGQRFWRGVNRLRHAGYWWVIYPEGPDR